jgi:Sugar (pentulose and hexulose) kinases
MSLLLGIDFGTSYFKVGLFDAAGTLKGLGRVAVEKDMPGRGWCEVPVPRFWSMLRRGLASALTEADATVNEIAAVSYASQANSFVCLDAAGEPLTSLILWTDARAEPVAPDVEAFSQRDEFARTVGFHGWSSGFAVAKWRWLQINQPDVWARSRHVLTLSDYFTFALTGERVADASTAAFLGLYDLSRRRWWPEALAAGRIETERLATPVRPGSVVGRTVDAAVQKLGLPAGVPFAVGGLDHHVAALGSGLGTSADVSISTGTVLAAMTLGADFEPKCGCYHGPHFDEGQFYRLAFDPDGAGQLEAYQREFAPELTLEQLLAQAATVPAASSTRKDPAASRGAAVRHLLEKIAAAQRALVGQVIGAAGVSRIVATGGGARSPLWLQIKADMFNVPVVTPSSPERASLGAAMLASIAAGWCNDAAQATAAMQSPGRIFMPDTETVERYRDWAP